MAWRTRRGPLRTLERGDAGQRRSGSGVLVHATALWVALERLPGQSRRGRIVSYSPIAAGEQRNSPWMSPH